MRAYVVRRLAILPVLLLGISIISFTLLNLAPGDPAYVLLKLEAPDVEPSREAVLALHQELGLDDSAVVRYGRWLLNTVQGDLGTSWRNGKPIMNELWQRLPATMALTGASLALAVLVSIPPLSAFPRRDSTPPCLNLTLASARRSRGPVCRDLRPGDSRVPPEARSRCRES